MLTREELSQKAVSASVDAGLRASVGTHDDWSGDFEIHHVVTRDAVKNSDFLEEVYGLDLYDQRFNSTENLILLPKHERDALALGMSQHKGSHPKYQEAIKQFHSDLLIDFNMEAEGLGDNALAELKEKYRKIHDRFEFTLKDGLVAQIAPGGDAKPAFQIYGQDAHLTASEKGWDKIYDDVYKNLTWADLKANSDLFEFDANGDFVISDSDFSDIKSERVQAGIYDPGHVGSDGHRMSSIERSLARRDEAVLDFAEALGRDVDDIIDGFDQKDFVSGPLKVSSFDADIIAHLKKAGFSIGAAGLISLISASAQAAAATKNAYDVQYLDGAETSEEATQAVVDDIVAALDGIRSEDVADLLLHMVIETEQQGRVAISFGAAGIGLYVADFALAAVGGLFDENEALQRIEPYVLELEAVIDSAALWFKEGIDTIDAALGNKNAEALIGSLGMEIDRDRDDVAEDGSAIQYMVGFDDATLDAGGGNDVLVHLGFGTALGGGGDDTLVAWRPGIVEQGELLVPDDPLSPAASENLFLTLDGGDGDDWIIKVGGEAAELIGGKGKDWIIGGGRGDEIDAPFTSIWGGEQGGDGDGERDDFWVYDGALVHDAEVMDRAFFAGMSLNGGVAFDWQEFNAAYWTPGGTALSFALGAFSQAAGTLTLLSTTIDAIAGLSFRYLTGTDGSLSVQFFAGRGGIASFEGYEIDVDAAVPNATAGITAFQMGFSSEATRSAEGLRQLISLIFDQAFGVYDPSGTDPLVLDLDGDGMIFRKAQEPNASAAWKITKRPKVSGHHLSLTVISSPGSADAYL